MSNSIKRKFRRFFTKLKKLRAQELFFLVAMIVGAGLLVATILNILYTNSSVLFALLASFGGGIACCLVALSIKTFNGRVFDMWYPGIRDGFAILIGLSVLFLGSCWIVPGGNEYAVIESNEVSIMKEGARFVAPFHHKVTYMERDIRLEADVSFISGEAGVMGEAQLLAELTASPQEMVQLTRKYDGAKNWKNKIQQTFKELANQEKTIGESGELGNILLTGRQVEKLTQLGYKPESRLMWRFIKNYKEK